MDWCEFQPLSEQSLSEQFGGVTGRSRSHNDKVRGNRAFDQNFDLNWVEPNLTKPGLTEPRFTGLTTVCHSSQMLPSPKSALVQVDGLTVQQGNYLAVHDVSFSLSQGTVTAIVGPNGAGKSTLVQAILGLIPRTAGTVEILGRSPNRLGSRGQAIGYIPQNFIFDRGFPISVAELVGLGWVPPRGEGWLNWAQQLAAWRQHRINKVEAIAQALHRVNAYHLRHQPIGTLSGGELKRVLLAYCLVMPRQLLVLDEAFAGVDTQGEADFYALLGELRQEQQWTILQISHDLEMVSRYCDNVLCLNRSLICQGHPAIALSTQNLLAAYGPSFTRLSH